jgi:erythromycin esterase-like protein/dienelactone hydrolase
MKAVIVFAHGSGSSRQSPRNQQVAKELNEAGFGTLLFDLLSDSEAKNRANVFDIALLSRRLVHATRWLRDQRGLDQMPVGYFGASTGVGAALQAAAQLNDSEAVFAVVSRGGRPDLAGFTLKLVKTPTLLLVGGDDLNVLELNRQAQKFLSYSKLFVIPGATHLFEEPGTMEEVSKQAIQWFNQTLRARKPNSLIKSVLTLDEAIEKEMIEIESEDDFDSLIESVKDTRVVMLGEASHGTEEFYQLRRLISQRLIKEHGFKFIAVEGDWPDAYRLNKYIQTGEGQSAKQVLMHNHRWPTWMWANDEVAKLAEWMRTYHVGFYGLDVYSLFESIDEVVKYLKVHRPDLASEIEHRYACFDLYEGDEISYARSLWKDPAGCESEVLLNLQNLLELRVQDVAQGADALFNSQQNARIVRNAEAYYRAMFGSDASSWNVRDSHMMETLDLLLERAGEGAKAIVWAHNTHVGDYRATDMKENGYINIGGLARQKYGADNVALVGFGTFQGSVLAGAAWGSAEQVMTLPMPPEESYEHHFHKAAVQASVNQFYLLLEDKTHTPFAQKMGHRAIGVVYDPRHEKRGNYVPTELSKRYDAFVFVDQSHALKSLHIPFALGEFPETWPMGQ